MLKDKISDAKLAEDSIVRMCFKNEIITELDVSKLEFELVQFSRFVACNFTGASFYNVTFENCDLSNCIFTNSYWKNAKIKDCKADGSNFNQNVFKEVQLAGSSFHYTNCVNTLWENCVIDKGN